jgi:hypothetical protein
VKTPWWNGNTIVVPGIHETIEPEKLPELGQADRVEQIFTPNGSQMSRPILTRPDFAVVNHYYINDSG